MAGRKIIKARAAFPSCGSFNACQSLLADGWVIPANKSASVSANIFQMLKKFQYVPVFSNLGGPSS